MRASLLFLLATTLLGHAAPESLPPPAWVPDLGDGTYRNPVLNADYSDPDAIRVGDDYYLVASSFLATPGLPLLHSRDLVNWTLIGHALQAQVPLDHFSRARHGQGVWAPALRHHDGKFWIYYPDPDFGLYVITAPKPEGPWSAPVMVKQGKGLIDPCPFWDDDGRLYLIHGWAKSRAGIGNQLSLTELSADGTRPLDKGTVIIDANQLPGWRTLEGPKLYKREGYYYVFAPAGGVKEGYQAVFRSRSLKGPYENRIVMDQGGTPINGPHQGAWVDTPEGEDWFLHFQDRDAFGRVVHLQPMSWRDGWPVIGSDPDGDGKGEPVLTHKKPAVGKDSPVAVPASSDSFSAPQLGLQWQWNANPLPHWHSLAERPGFLRLYCSAAPTTRNDGSPATDSLYDAPHFLLQKFPAPAFTATTSVELGFGSPHNLAGLTVFGFNYAVLGVQAEGTQQRVSLLAGLKANEPGARHTREASVLVPKGAVYLRVTVNERGLCQFSWSTDNQAFAPIGKPFPTHEDRWIGAKVGLIATTHPEVSRQGHADFDWFYITGDK
jgi:beta-xylosidase